MPDIFSFRSFYCIMRFSLRSTIVGWTSFAEPPIRLPLPWWWRSWSSSKLTNSTTTWSWPPLFLCSTASLLWVTHIRPPGSRTTTLSLFPRTRSTARAWRRSRRSSRRLKQSTKKKASKKLNDRIQRRFHLRIPDFFLKKYLKFRSKNTTFFFYPFSTRKKKKK